MKKIFSLVSAMIFVSLAFFPLIEGEIEPDVTKEVTVEIHTLNGTETITRKLPIITVNKISSLVNETKEQGNMENLLFELDAQGFFGDYSIEEIKLLVEGNYHLSTNVMEKLGFIPDTDNPLFENIMINAVCCFMASGFSVGVFPYSSIPFLLYFLSLFLKMDVSLIFLSLLFILLSLEIIPHPTTIGLWVISDAHFGRTTYKAELYTLGILGEQELKEQFIYALTFGFTGLSVMAVNRYTLGCALFVGAIRDRPP